MRTKSGEAFGWLQDHTAHQGDEWVPADNDALPQFGGWYCEPCDEYAETED